MNEPSKRELLTDLIASIKPGDRYELVNHDYYRATGPRIVTSIDHETLNSKRPGHGQQGPFAWPKEDDDYEIHGRTLKIFNPKHAYVHGGRAIILEFKF